MAWQEELHLQLMTAFEAEAREHLERLPLLLVELERKESGDSSRQEWIAEIFRLVHSLKGAARAVDLRRVEELSHQMESLLGDLRAGRVEVTAPRIDLLLRSVDGLSALVAEALAGPEEGGSKPSGREESGPEEWEALGTELESAREAGWGPSPSAPQPAAPDPAPPDPVTPEPAPPAPAPASRTGAEEETVRVATSRIDGLLAQTGELLAARIRIDQLFAEVKALAAFSDAMAAGWSEQRQALTPDSNLGEFLHGHQGELATLTKRVKSLSRSLTRERSRLGVITQDLQEGVRSLRLVPVETLFQALPRLVRDLARSQEKQVELELVGGETPLDKRILEQLKGPVMHLVSNALDHGVERPAERLARGKGAQGTIRLWARQLGSRFLLTVADDGAGIDLEAVRRTALASGLVSQLDLAAMSREEMLQLIFRPGLSTRTTATAISGRGVGLDVVRRNVDRMQGRLSVESEEGQGAQITLAVPLVVTHTEGLLVRAGGQLLALPAAAVDRVERVRPSAITPVAASHAVLIEGRPVAVVHLADLLGLARAARVGDSKSPLVVLTSAAGRVALWVDELAGQQEMVVKSLGSQLARVRNVAGATILGSGQPVIVLDPADLVRSALARGGSALPIAPPSAGEEVARGPARILVVDDSITTRTLERTILESAGFAVQTAADGQEAWGMLQAELFDLVVTDVEMPRMNGFELTAVIRSTDRIKDLPVILVTSRESREDRERGVDVGADAYLVKSRFDQDELMHMIRQFI